MDSNRLLLLVTIFALTGPSFSQAEISDTIETRIVPNSSQQETMDQRQNTDSRDLLRYKESVEVRAKLEIEKKDVNDAALFFEMLRQLGYSQELISDVKAFSRPSLDREYIEHLPNGGLLQKEDGGFIGDAIILGYMTGSRYWCMNWITQDLVGSTPDTRNWWKRALGFQSDAGLTFQFNYHYRCWQLIDNQVVQPTSMISQ